jgi:hypothetical protein
MMKNKKRELKTGTPERCCVECRHSFAMFSKPVLLGKQYSLWCNVDGEIHYPTPDLVCDKFKPFFEKR